jgi:hypothetical protein
MRERPDQLKAVDSDIDRPIRRVEPQVLFNPSWFCADRLQSRPKSDTMIATLTIVDGARP